MPCIVPIRFAVPLVLLALHAWSAHGGILSGDAPKAEEGKPKVNTQEALVGTYDLPDPLTADGTRIRSTTEWKARRSELLRLFENHVYGRAPGRPQAQRFEILEHDPHAQNGKATYKRVAVHSREGESEHRFVIDLYLPNQRKGRVPVFLLINHRNTSTIDPAATDRQVPSPARFVVSRGYGIAEIQTSEIAPDHPARFRDGVISLFDSGETGDRASDRWGAVAAWAWGASRAMDYLQKAPGVDADRIALVGHSRGGKAALWAGALDMRFDMVVANDSGEGGAALARRNFGETVAIMNDTFPHWFAPAYRQYGGREHALPVDQHMLLSLIAPRPLYISSATEDRWADPRGEFLGLANSSPVYALWNEKPIRSDDMPPPDEPLIVGRRGYHIRSGGHDLKLYDWQRFLDFADRIWRKPAGRS